MNNITWRLMPLKKILIILHIICNFDLDSIRQALLSVATFPFNVSTLEYSLLCAVSNRGHNLPREKHKRNIAQVFDVWIANKAEN